VRLEALLAELTADSSNQTVMAELYALIRVPVYAYALSLVKNPYDAEDILHDTVISIHDSIGSYCASGKPMAWIITIAKNHGYGRLRRQKHVADVPEEMWDSYLEGNDRVSVDDRILLDQCLNVLSATERQIVVMHTVTGMKHRRIAAVLELPLSTVLSKYNRALRKIRKNMQID
jgi:RNA polymerase sigma-70 factor (ECF subfamily)